MKSRFLVCYVTDEFFSTKSLNITDENQTGFFDKINCGDLELSFTCYEVFERCYITVQRLSGGVWREAHLDRKCDFATLSSLVVSVLILAVTGIIMAVLTSVLRITCMSSCHTLENAQ